jgi:hypothetical protein
MNLLKQRAILIREVAKRKRQHRARLELGKVLVDVTTRRIRWENRKQRKIAS